MKLAQIPNIQIPTTGKASFNINDPNLNIGTVISALLPYIFTFSGIILLVYIVMGGLQLMLSAGDPKKAESAKAHITNALIGFIIIFFAYWVVRLFGVILGLTGITNT